MHNQSNSFYFKFWGVRGSIASPGPDTQIYGGNTPCVEIGINGQIFVFDGGTGLKRLGQKLNQTTDAKKVNLFLSHLHWDHIQGIPFFSSAFIKQNHIKFFGERKGQQSLKEILESQMQSPNFPVPLSIMQAKLEFEEIYPHQSIVFQSREDEIILKTAPMNHTNGCLGFRLSYQGQSIVYCTDTEHTQGQVDQNVIDLAKNADIFIYDAMYTEAEYLNGKIGWGHSTYEEAIKLASLAQVKKLFFFHHDPEHSDHFLSDQLDKWRAFCLENHLPFEIEMATEGILYHL